MKYLERWKEFKFFFYFLNVGLQKEHDKLKVEEGVLSYYVKEYIHLTEDSMSEYFVDVCDVWS